ncbi:hypothetical protein [Neobacillus rhizophilus]|uniref:Uncharacterized protein n=1 Tax=Neobacillus rhizophilus TaxID=2833579 RepID=A0A942U8E9_9BACI|nr:hypothetical protein [Neobacillus rhizophilus]MBS4216670.1 hypothetical protein [Neobacillus rhizophilus]MBU8920120.1 hypothetical protein [Bacillus sp. FJAT-29953]
MNTVLTYVVSLFMIVISVFTTLYIKSELERVLHEKTDTVPFHICNIVIIIMASLLAHAVMTKYVMGNKIDLMLQIVIHMFMIFPIYILGNIAFEKYKTVYRKYLTTENRKVVVLNEKYLKKKKRFTKLNKYNAVSKEK